MDWHSHFRSWMMVLAGGYFLGAIGYLMLFIERRKRKNHSPSDGH